MFGIARSPSQNFKAFLLSLFCRTLILARQHQLVVTMLFLAHFVFIKSEVILV